MNSEQPNKKNKIWTKVFFVVIVLAAVLAVMAKVGDLGKVFQEIGQTNKLYLTLAVIMALLFFSLTSISNQVVLRALDKTLSYRDGFMIHTTEFFFNAITPFSSGAQPFQAYMFIKKGVDSKDTTSTLVVNFIIYQTTMMIVSILAMIFYGRQIADVLGDKTFIVWIGFIFNIVILVILFLLAYVKGVYKVFQKMFLLMGKIKRLEAKSKKLHDKTEGFIVKFQAGVNFLFTKKSVFLKAFGLKIVTLITQYSVPILVLYAFRQELKLEQIVHIMAMTSLAMTVMLWVPLPGASGGIEWAFAVLVAPIIGLAPNDTLVLSATLVWRILTYYLGLIYGGLCYFIVNTRRVKNENRDINGRI